MTADYLSSNKASALDHREEVVVVCRDDSCYVAKYYESYYLHEKPCWFVDGPHGCARRLQKKVLWWMPRPHLLEEEDYAETCM